MRAAYRLGCACAASEALLARRRRRDLFFVSAACSAISTSRCAASTIARPADRLSSCGRSPPLAASALFLGVALAALALFLGVVLGVLFAAAVALGVAVFDAARDAAAAAAAFGVAVFGVADFEAGADARLLLGVVLPALLGEAAALRAIVLCLSGAGSGRRASGREVGEREGERERERRAKRRRREERERQLRHVDAFVFPVSVTLSLSLYLPLPLSRSSALSCPGRTSAMPKVISRSVVSTDKPGDNDAHKLETYHCICGSMALIVGGRSIEGLFLLAGCVCGGRVECVCVCGVCVWVECVCVCVEWSVCGCG